MAVKIAKLEARSGYYFESGEKLITAKPIMQLEAPDIVEKYLKNEKVKKNLFLSACIYYRAKHFLSL